MARQVGRLSALKVGRLREPGMYPDGAGLYLQVSGTGTKSWIYRFMLAGRAREMGLGPLHTVPLADARKLAQDARQLRLAGVDPIEHRRERLEALRAERARTVTFDEAAQTYIASHEKGWRNAKHGAQWRATLNAYASPIFGKLSVKEIDTGLVAKALEPIWVTKTETASRVRGRIESVLDWATARGHRSGDNPARWKGHLENILPKRSRVQKVVHRPALPYDEIGQFVAQLRKEDGVGPQALEFLILTATRTSETIGARWSEIDLRNAMWTIPADRIKAGREHRVPLSERAVTILSALKKEQLSEWVFPGGKAGKPLSNMALLALLKRMKRADLTVHGFRSTFRDWAAERTNYPREMAEQALAHAIPDKVEAAYRRGDLLAKRRRLMTEWSKFCGCEKKAAQVLTITSSPAAA
jgi:integrase